MSGPASAAPATTTDAAAPASGVRLISWQTFAFLTIASTGSIAQLPAVAEYGLGAITLYLIPALLFLLRGAGGWPVAVLVATVAGAAVLVGEIAVAVRWLGARIERFDLSTELR